MVPDLLTGCHLDGQHARLPSAYSSAQTELPIRSAVSHTCFSISPSVPPSHSGARAGSVPVSCARSTRCCRRSCYRRSVSRQNQPVCRGQPGAPRQQRRPAAMPSYCSVNAPLSSSRQMRPPITAQADSGAVSVNVSAVLFIIDYSRISYSSTDPSKSDKTFDMRRHSPSSDAEMRAHTPRHSFPPRARRSRRADTSASANHTAAFVSDYHSFDRYYHHVFELYRFSRIGSCVSISLGVMPYSAQRIRSHDLRLVPCSHAAVQAAGNRVNALVRTAKPACLPEHPRCRLSPCRDCPMVLR